MAGKQPHGREGRKGKDIQSIGLGEPEMLRNMLRKEKINYEWKTYIPLLALQPLHCGQRIWEGKIEYLTKGVVILPISLTWPKLSLPSLGLVP